MKELASENSTGRYSNLAVAERFFARKQQFPGKCAVSRENPQHPVHAPETSVRAVASGVLLGAVVASVNVYMGLKIGLTEGGSIFAAILGFGILRLWGRVGRAGTLLETNIAQTAASASGVLAGVVITVVAALALMGRPMSYGEMTLYLAAVALLGVFYAIPLRRQLVEVEGLPFPTGTATAATIRALHATDGLGARQARTLGLAGAVAGLVTWFRDGAPAVIRAHLFPPIGSLLGYDPRQLTLGLYVSPMLLGVGLIVGLRVGGSLLAGSLLCWGGLAPWLAGRGVVEEVSFRSVTAWTLWPGMAILIAYGLAAAVLRGPTLVRGVLGLRLGREGREEVSLRLWLVGFAALAFVAALIVRLAFGVPYWMGLGAVLLSFVLALVSVRAAGETDINPTGTMGHTTQMVFGALARGQPHVNLLAAGVTSAGASQAADLMQDLKAGYLLGASPRRQVWAQVVGVLTGVIVIVPVYLLVTRAHGLGSEMLPAPVAAIWSGFARVLAEGGEPLPTYAGRAVLVGAGAGIVLAVLDRTRLRAGMPSAVGLGVAMVIPAIYCIPIFLGSVGKVVFQSLARRTHERHAVSIASGGIVGEGLVGILVAALKLVGLLR